MKSQQSKHIRPSTHSSAPSILKPIPKSSWGVDPTRSAGARPTATRATKVLQREATGGVAQASSYSFSGSSSSLCSSCVSGRLGASSSSSTQSDSSSFAFAGASSAWPSLSSLASSPSSAPLSSRGPHPKHGQHIQAQSHKPPHTKERRNVLDPFKSLYPGQQKQKQQQHQTKNKPTNSASKKAKSKAKKGSLTMVASKGKGVKLVVPSVKGMAKGSTW